MQSATEATGIDRWSAVQRQLGQRLAQRLFDELRRDPVRAGRARAGRPSWSLALAYSLAAMVYVVGAAAGVAGVMLLTGPWSNLLVLLAGLILVLLCIASRPRLPPPPDVPLERVDYPALYDLSDRIARQIGAPAVDVLAVSPDFNANYRVAGWRGRRCVELGTALLAVLTPSERVAVIAHELSHGANGDPLRGQFLYGAVHTVSTWAMAVRPLSIGRLGDGQPLGPIVSLAAIPLELLMVAASELLLLGARGLLLLVLRESQRAEYLADLLAATVAGSTEMQAALEKTYLADVVEAALRTHALTRPDDAVGPGLMRAVQALSTSEREQYRQNSRARQWQVDATHPPTALRVEMLATHPPRPAPALLSSSDLTLLDAEIDRLVASTHRELMNRQLAAIHG